MILWSAAGVSPADVLEELAKRRGVSGFERDAARGKAGEGR